LEVQVLSRPAVVDCDGHVTEHESDVKRHLAAPWNQRQSGLLARDQPWDNYMTVRGKLSKRPYPAEGVEYSRGMSPREQIDAWHRVMDEHRIERAICFSSSGGRVGKLREPEWQMAVARAYNDHFAQDFNALSDRVQCVGILPMAFPEAAAAELTRAVTELGIRGFELVTCGMARGYGDAFYDPIYAEAQRLGVPICFHGTRAFADELGAAAFTTFSEVHTYSFTAGMLLHFTSVILQGLPIRFPELKLAFLEIGATWLPYYLDRLDEHWEQRAEVETPLLTRRPSEIVRASKMYFSIESGETLLAPTIAYVGDEHFVYASDIPHWDNEFPHSLDRIWNHPDLSDDTKLRLVRDNAMELFGLSQPDAALQSAGRN
jgi:uncharacterized protein